MSKLSTAVQELIAKQEVFPIATANPDGTPNVVPMTFVKVYDENNLLIVDNFMNKTRGNLTSNPQMAVCVWDLKAGQAYQIKGKTTRSTSGKVFDEAETWVKEKMPGLQAQAAVLLHVEKVFVCQPGEELGKEV
ncbi:pyridoxal 5'-phosphate synthase [Acididesulfobacillus acetoxydans]|uniref:Pyridoxal 5'-phosphate synthase n=1 Tax=Acididesulfobacillus acetoxydans TaxID=1561005 RepID=A0A8S0X1T7_9FIRM|nr:pyridoxamine 5'-phosphate oxidase family protein [Acididesulfobacillus acetoxydans]CAA7601452.1 pyridoxal 5'-phosphate synthase [Acididesulfobacillus acetoxydans]CAA7603291.1 pyridoxal 5'-phosphate synthase [Acididesulfobacillus acetoxydans]